MKASELNVGQEVAVTEGNGRYDRKPERATRCKVATAPEGGYVRVEVLEKPKSALGRRGFNARKDIKVGDIVNVRTTWLWVPWPEIAEIAAEARKRQEHDARLESERIQREEAIQARVDAIVGKDEGRLMWSRHYGPTISIEGLEALLDAAEAKR